MKTPRQLTKDDLKLIAQQWESKTREEIATIIGCSPHTVTKIASQMRGLGLKLPKKRDHGVLKGLIMEVLDEL